MEKKKHNISKASALLTTLFIGLIVATLYISQLPMEETVMKEQIMEQKKWVQEVLGDANPGAGNTGFMYFMAYPHSGDPGTDYASNLSNATAFEYTDSLGGVELTGEYPHGQAGDFVWKVRVNKSDGYNDSGSTWENSWTRSNITIDFDFLADLNDVAMTQVVIGTGADYRWYHYYVNNAGSGYTLEKNEKYNVTALTFDVWE